MSSHSAPGIQVGQDPGPSPSRRRLFGFRAALIFASLLPVMWGVSSVQSALGGGTHLVHDLIGGGVVLNLLWLAPLIAMWRPRRLPGALLCYFAIVAAAVIAAVMSSSNEVVGVILVLQAGLVTLLHPDRRAALRQPVAISPSLLPVALLTAAVLVRYAVSEAALQATGDDHAVVAHYFDQAWFALAVPLLAVLAALRSDVRRFAGTVSGLALIAFGAVSIALPDVSSSVGVAWGAIAILAGVGTLAFTTLETRRTSNAEPAPSPAAI
jgi:hypothetical protein